MKCNICNREQYKTGTRKLKIGNQSMDIQCYNINIMTHWNGIDICDDCMDTYNKINAIMTDTTFSCGGNNYFADGRNLTGKPYTEEEFEHKTFYTVEPIFEKVSEEEFKSFICKYPNKLDVDCWGACEPPLISYNDFSIATHFPNSIIAKHDGGEPNEYYGLDYKRKYYVASNYKEVLDSIVK